MDESIIIDSNIIHKALKNYENGSKGSEIRQGSEHEIVVDLCDADNILGAMMG